MLTAYFILRGSLRRPTPGHGFPRPLFVTLRHLLGPLWMIAGDRGTVHVSGKCVCGVRVVGRARLRSVHLDQALTAPRHVINANT